jgi:capsule polysaccharide export protein KpsE/RkpR
MAAQTEILRPPDESAATAFETPIAPNWLHNLRVLWQNRGLLVRVAAIALVANLILSLLIPRTYVSSARIMPPENAGSTSALVASLAGRSVEGGLLGGLAASLLGSHDSGALFVDLLRSSSIAGRLIDRFQLQQVYRKRYRIDAAKLLARRTAVSQDKKSGVITLSVTDRDPVRARDMAQAYLQELNAIVNRTSTSPAHQERVFIEKRRADVKAQLDRAQESLSQFSSMHNTIDLPEQTRASVESEAKVQGEWIVAQGELVSLEQVYGDNNVRVRAAQARLAVLKKELGQMGGTDAPLPTASQDDVRTIAYPGSDGATSYLPLRQVPRLAVPYADLYRDVHVQETVFDLLTEQYEVARIQEAKDVPAVNIIDDPGIPEKKSFPPVTILTLSLTLLTFLVSSMYLLLRDRWRALHVEDPRRTFACEIATVSSLAMHRTVRLIRRTG